MRESYLNLSIIIIYCTSLPGPAPSYFKEEIFFKITKIVNFRRT